jgi:hypothetical protein
MLMENYTYIRNMMMVLNMWCARECWRTDALRKRVISTMSVMRPLDLRVSCCGELTNGT